VDDSVYIEEKFPESDGDEYRSHLQTDASASTSIITQQMREIVESDFVEPTVVIRINRLWYDGISADALYEATRKWWRVRYDVVKDCKIALSVANGIVREVYQIKDWYGDNENIKNAYAEETKERLQFEGEPAESEIG